MASSVLGIDHRVEKKGDEVGKVVGVKVGKQDVRNPMPIHARFDEIHQGTWAEIQQNVLIGSHQIPSRCSRGMHIGAGAKNSQAHGLNQLWLRSNVELIKDCLSFHAVRIGSLGTKLGKD